MRWESPPTFFSTWSPISEPWSGARCDIRAPAWDWVFILDLTRDRRSPSCRSLPRGVTGSRDNFGAAPLACGPRSLPEHSEPICSRAPRDMDFRSRLQAVVSAIFAVRHFLAGRWGAGFRWTRASWCRAGLAVLCAYIGLAAAAHHKALADVQRFAAAQHLQVESLAALALPPTLTHWVGLVSTPEGVWRTTFHEPGGAIENTQLYLAAQSAPADRRGTEAARCPDLSVVCPISGLARVHAAKETRQRLKSPMCDSSAKGIPLRSPTRPSQNGSAPPVPRTGFTFEIVFDAQGRVISHGFKEPE